jgi:hypothetical protein
METRLECAIETADISKTVVERDFADREMPFCRIFQISETKALEDTEYLMILGGPILFFDEDNFLGYQGWEEFHRDQQKHSA